MASRSRGELAPFEGDAEFKSFPPAVQQRILADAEATRAKRAATTGVEDTVRGVLAGPKLPTPGPSMPQDPRLHYRPQARPGVRERVDRAAKEALAGGATGMAAATAYGVAGAAGKMTADAASRAGAFARETPRETFDRELHKVPAAMLEPPPPSWGEMGREMVDAITTAPRGLAQNLYADMSQGREVAKGDGFDEGAVSLLGSSVDPLGDLVLGKALKVGAPMAANAVSRAIGASNEASEAIARRIAAALPDRTKYAPAHGPLPPPDAPRAPSALDGLPAHVVSPHRGDPVPVDPFGRETPKNYRTGKGPAMAARRNLPPVPDLAVPANAHPYHAKIGQQAIELLQEYRAARAAGDLDRARQIGDRIERMDGLQWNVGSRPSGVGDPPRGDVVGRALEYVDQVENDIPYTRAYQSSGEGRPHPAYFREDTPGDPHISTDARFGEPSVPSKVLRPQQPAPRPMAPAMERPRPDAPPPDAVPTYEHVDPGARAEGLPPDIPENEWGVGPRYMLGRFNQALQRGDTQMARNIAEQQRWWVENSGPPQHPSITPEHERAAMDWMERALERPDAASAHEHVDPVRSNRFAPSNPGTHVGPQARDVARRRVPGDPSGVHWARLDPWVREFREAMRKGDRRAAEGLLYRVEQARIDFRGQELESAEALMDWMARHINDEDWGHRLTRGPAGAEVTRKPPDDAPIIERIGRGAGKGEDLPPSQQQGQAAGLFKKRSGSILWGSGDADPAIRDLQKQRAQALRDGNTTRAMELERAIREAKDARAILEPDHPTGSTTAPPTNYYNERKYGFATPESRDAFDRAVRAIVHAEGWNPKKVVPRAVIERGAAEMTGDRIDDLQMRKLGPGESLNAVEYRAAQNVANELADRIADTERRLNAIPTSNRAEREAAEAVERELFGLEKDLRGFLSVLIPSRSQKGRDLAYLKMVARNGFDIDFWASRAERISGVVNPGYMSELRAAVSRGRAAEALAPSALRDEALRLARIDIAKALAKMHQTKPTDVALALRKAGLLTGVKTIGRNNVSNIANAGLEEVASIPAAVLDAMLGVAFAGGRRTTTATSWRKIRAGLGEVLTRGVREFGEVMVHGIPLENLAALEIPKEVNSGSAILDTYINGTFRFQAAQDRLYKAYALRRSLLDQAELELANASLGSGPRMTPAMRRAAIDNLAANPTEEMMREAVAAAEFATFQNDTAVSRFIAAARRGAKAYSNETGSPAGEWLDRGFDFLVPFVKTPAAITARVVDYSPIAGEALRTASKRRARIKAERALGSPSQFLTADEQRGFARGIARGAVGSSLVGIGYLLYQRGGLTGNFNPGRREEDEAAGRSPGAILWRGEWRPIGWASPLGNLLVLGATLAREGLGDDVLDRKNPARGAFTAGILAAQTVLDQPMMQGAKDAVGVMSPDTEGVGRAAQRAANNYAGSLVPSIINEVAQATDMSGADRVVNGMGDAMKKRVPFARQTLPTKRTALGDPVEVGRFFNAFNPAAGRTARDENDPAVRAVLETGAQLPKMPRTFDPKGSSIGVVLTPEEQQDLWAEMGYQVRTMLEARLGQYEATNDEGRRRAVVEEAIAKGTQNARAIFEAKHPDLKAPDRQSESASMQEERADRRRTPLPPAPAPAGASR